MDVRPFPPPEIDGPRLSRRPREYQSCLRSFLRRRQQKTIRARFPIHFRHVRPRCQGGEGRDREGAGEGGREAGGGGRQEPEARRQLTLAMMSYNFYFSLRNYRFLGLWSQLKKGEEKHLPSSSS